MKKGLWIGMGLLLSLFQPVFAAKPTMQYASQPSSTVYTLPISFGLYNLAPVPQNLCGATISTSTETATCSGLPLCKGAKAKQASFSCSVTTNCRYTVPSNKAGGRCTVDVNVIKPSTLSASTSFTFDLSYGSYDALLTSHAFILNGTNPTPPASNYRTITFKNSCHNPIWFGTVGGAAPTANVLTGGAIDCSGNTGNPGKLACVAAGGACYGRIGLPDACLSQQCSSDSDCLLGASCYAANHKCYWNNPLPNNDQHSFLLGESDTTTIQIPEYESNGIGIVWSGAWSGRTGCTSGTCVSALCTAQGESAQGVCSIGTGFQQPATQAEPTLITYPTNTGLIPTDAYDVTVINGANVPMSMYPTGFTVPSTDVNPYTCGAPGYNAAVPSGQSSANTLGGSSWAFNTNQSNLAYRYVIPSSPITNCSSDGDCASGQNCGLSYQSIGTSPNATGHLVCGVFAGWFTADEICGTNPAFTMAYNADNQLVYNFQCSTSASIGTMANLYQCNLTYQTCYQNNAPADCCGCVNWGDISGVTFPSLPVPTNTNYVTACNQTSNTQWTGSFSTTQPQVLDTIYYLKQSCPSCYAYPFDDASSSFTCSNPGISESNNTQNYTVEFCQGGAGNSGFQPDTH